MMREYRLPVLPLLWLVVSSVTTQAVLAASLEEQNSQAAPLDCVINPSVVADLGSGVPGILSEVRVDRSDFIEAGEVVAQLDSGVEVAARDLARVRAEKDTEIKLRRVNAAFGRRQHARSKDLFQRKVLSTNDMDERETEVKLANVQLRQAIDNKEIATLELARSEEVLKRRTIKSPISGVVMERFKTIGEYVDEQPVLRVAQLDPLHVEVFVPVEQLGDIRPGMRAEVWSDAVSGKAWDAEVTRVDKVADVASGTYGVRLVLPNPDYKVPAGLRCRLAFQPQPVLPLADDAADLGSADLVAVDGKKKPAPGEPPSDVVVVGDTTPVQVEDGAPADVTDRSVGEGTSEIATAEKPATVSITESAPFGRDEPPAGASEQVVDKDAREIVTAPSVDEATADRRERALAEEAAEAAASLVDDDSIRAPTGKAHVIAAKPAEPIAPSIIIQPVLKATEQPAPKGFFDKIIAAVTDQPDANQDEQRPDTDHSDEPAADAKVAASANTKHRTQAVNTADALAGRIGDAAPVVRNVRRTEVNTRDALTGRINLDLPVEVVDEIASVCISAGPYDSEAIATAQALRLRDAGLSVDVKAETTSVGIGYRVVSAPLDKRSDARALISRLKQAGVKDYFVAGSERTSFRVMLGSFSSAAGAKRRIKHMARLGVEAQRQPWNRNVAVYKLLVFGTPTADAEALLTQLPIPSDGTPPAHCEQFAAR